MSFSGAQQRDLRRELPWAWQAFCQREGIGTSAAGKCLRGARCKLPGCAFCGWYVRTLEAATGCSSTTECDKGRDFERFMAALEGIHGRSARWNLLRQSGDARRIFWALKRWPGHGMDEIYLRRIAAKVCCLPGLPELADLDNTQIALVTAAAKRTAEVKSRGRVAGDLKENCPF